MLMDTGPSRRRLRHIGPCRHLLSHSRRRLPRHNGLCRHLLLHSRLSFHPLRRTGVCRHLLLHSRRRGLLRRTGLCWRLPWHFGLCRHLLLYSRLSFHPLRRTGLCWHLPWHVDCLGARLGRPATKPLFKLHAGFLLQLSYIVAIVANNAVYEGTAVGILDGEDYLALVISGSSLVPGPDLQLGPVATSYISNPPGRPLAVFEAPSDIFESHDDGWSIAVKRRNVAPPRLPGLRLHYLT